ncbi:hypothetical protein [Thalassobacillus sp. C254]|uniref:hypothetical protein n=1 Tax=Thalassobacillus sp. C254 TaxID=1225341 RepID=UPI0006D06D9B|nr:hypothetical protein [Thalassobacillus sp. C254]
MSVQSAKQSAQTRGMGNKRVARIPVSTTNEYDKKLTRLSIATGGMSKSRIVDIILRIGLDSPNVVEFIQEQYGAQYEEFHVTPMVVSTDGNKEVVYRSR